MASLSESRLTLILVEARVGQRLGVAGQERAVGGQRDVIDPGQIGQQPDQHGQVAPEQRLAAGQAQLAYAERHEQPGQATDLLERQQLRPR